jgi:hypothetical protein
MLTAAMKLHSFVLKIPRHMKVARAGQDQGLEAMRNLMEMSSSLSFLTLCIRKITFLGRMIVRKIAIQ